MIDLEGDVSGQALDKVPAPSPTLQTLLQPIDPAVLPKSGWWRTLSATVPRRGKGVGSGEEGGSARVWPHRQLGSWVRSAKRRGQTELSHQTTDAMSMLHSDAIRQTGDGRWRTDKMGENKHAFQRNDRTVNWFDNMLPWWCHIVYNKQKWIHYSACFLRNDSIKCSCHSAFHQHSVFVRWNSSKTFTF